MIHFDHPYPRYGLAVTLLDHSRANLPDTEAELAQMIAETLQHTLNFVRVHTCDDPKDETVRELRYAYVPADKLKTSGQSSADLYYMTPHVVTNDGSTNSLIREVQSFVSWLQEAKLSKLPELKRSFSPFTRKINQGKKTLTNPTTRLIDATLITIATLAPNKPAACMVRWEKGKPSLENQAIIPDLDLPELISFVDLFGQMARSEAGELFVAPAKEIPGYKYRPRLHRGNYPGAPPSPVFGPIGLLGAMGRWARTAQMVPFARCVLEAMQQRALYLVSHDWKLMRTEHLGNHVAKLALEHDLPEVIYGLYRAQLYNHDKKKRELFLLMASRFLQLFSRAAFRDFLSFRAHYDSSFAPILEAYFMRQLSEDIVQSARVYGSYLNKVAFFKAQDEYVSRRDGNQNDNEEQQNRKIAEFKNRTLAQLESTAMSARSASALFAQLNVTAGRFSHYDVPPEAERFIQAAIIGNELDAVTARELVLAFMRLQTDRRHDGTGDTGESGDDEFIDENA